jgi:hypothetical protein
MTSKLILHNVSIEYRPYSSLDNMTPSDFARSLTIGANKPDY